MTTLFITLHVITAILFIGVMCVATSAFPAQIEKAAAGDASAHGAASLLHRLCNGYGYISAIVPILGAGVFLMDLPAYKHQVQFHVALLLAVIAWCLLFFLIMPQQKKAMAAIEARDTAAAAALKKKLSAFSGIFNLLWAVCAILMFV